MTNRSNFRRVTRREPCPICEHPDWCLVTGPENFLSAAICARIESPKAVGKKGAGWLHVIREDDRREFQRRQTVVTVEPERPDFAALAKRYAFAVKADHLAGFAADLGLSPDSLRRLGVGWAGDRFAWSFPMSDARGKVIGLRLRAINGRKFCATGSATGLFLPSGLSPVGGALLICEGPTDTAALLDLGFAAVGRPSCRGGVDLLIELVRRMRPAYVAILSDVDPEFDKSGRPHRAGQRGAEDLAEQLLAVTPCVRIIEPPAGIKDARAWKRSGATAADVQAAIDEASARQLAISYGMEACA